MAINQELTVPERRVQTAPVPLPVSFMGDAAERDRSVRLSWHPVLGYGSVLFAWLEIGQLQPGTRGFITLPDTQPQDVLAEDGFVIIGGLRPSTTYAARIRFQDPSKPEDEQYSSYVVSEEFTTDTLIDELTFGAEFIHRNFLTQGAGTNQPIVIPRASGGVGAITYTLLPNPPLWSGLTFDADALTISGNPHSREAGKTLALTIVATDEVGETSSISVRIFAMRRILFAGTPQNVVILGGEDAQDGEIIATWEYDTRYLEGFAASPAEWSQVRLTLIPDGGFTSRDSGTVITDNERVYGTRRVWRNLQTLYTSGRSTQYLVQIQLGNSRGVSGFQARQQVFVGGGGPPPPPPPGPTFAEALIRQEVRVGEDLNIPFPAVSNGFGELTYTHSSGTLPNGVELDLANARIVGRATRVGQSSNVLVIVSDELNRQSVITITIFVVAEDIQPDAPEFASANSPAITVTVDRLINMKLPTAIGGTEPLVYSLSPALPDDLVYTPATNRISGRARPALAGTNYQAGRLTVVDGDRRRAQTTITINFVNERREPTINPKPAFAVATFEQSVEQGQRVDVQLPAATGADRYDLIGEPPWATLLTMGRTYRLAPGVNVPAVPYQAAYRAFNESGFTDLTVIFTVTEARLTGPDLKPVFFDEGFNIDLVTGDRARFSFPFAVGGNGPLQYRYEGDSLPQGLARSGNLIEGTPQTAGQTIRGSWIVRDADGDETSIPVVIKTLVKLGVVSGLKATPNPLIVGALIVAWGLPAGHTSETNYKIESKLQRSGATWIEHEGTHQTSKVIYGLISGEAYSVRVTPSTAVQTGPESIANGTPA